jgi:CHAT domain-containing protein
MLISQPFAAGLPPIPSTQKEVRDLKVLMEGTAVNVLLLEDSEATKESVTAGMKSYGWVHFACHSMHDVLQPLVSGLYLNDGRLELLEILKQQIPNADFAFLSASETSKGDPKLSEEVVHFTAGMLAAGYRGVVGTMWTISDMTRARVCNRVLSNICLGRDPRRLVPGIRQYSGCLCFGLCCRGKFGNVLER